MSFSIAFDYRYDNLGFFLDPSRRAALDIAADAWEAVIGDAFDDVPAGVAFDVRNPSDPTRLETVTLDAPIDDVLIFVGARDLGSTTLGRGGPTGYSASGSAFSARISSDYLGQGPVTDFEPWAGTVVFDSDRDWVSTGPFEVGTADLISVAIHEIGHVLGIGTSAAWDALVSGGVFTGVNATAVNGGTPVPLSSDLGHPEDGIFGNTVTMDPIANGRVRTGLTDLDKALLADIGYQIAGFAPQGTQFAVATAGNDTIWGTIVGDDISALAGDDYVDGEAGDDRIAGGAGNDDIYGGAGADIFVFEDGFGTDVIWDFAAGEDVIAFGRSVFGNVSEIMAAISHPYSNGARITAEDGSSVTVIGSNGVLTEADFTIETSGDDRIAGTAGADEIFGGAGDDTIIASAGSDLLDGGAGTDTVLYAGHRAQFTLTLGPDGVTVQDRAAGADEDRLVGIERLDFEADGEGGAFDLTQFVGAARLAPDDLESIVELYIAYFNRAPDAIGLSFWANAYANGAGLSDLARFFAEQAETRASYPAGMDNADLATTVYNNVLGRAPDGPGLAFWVGHLDAGTITTDGFILEVLRAAQGSDVDYLETKTEIGGYFAVHLGMSDGQDGRAVMALYDGTEESVSAAVAAARAAYHDALDAETGTFLMPITGVLDTPFGDLA